MRIVRSLRSLPSILAVVVVLATLAQPAAAELEAALKALQAGDMPTTEKELQLLAKERDPRAQFLLGLYVYGNPESKLHDPAKATPMLLDAAERGYLSAILPLAGAYVDGKGVQKSASEAYKWVAIAAHWNVVNADLALEQAGHLLKPDEIEKAKAAALVYTFKTQ